VRDKGDNKDKNQTTNDIKISKGETDLNSILKKRIEGIQDEMSKFNKNINDFASTCDTELNNLIGNINLL
jgi:hypothetical protein